MLEEAARKPFFSLVILQNLQNARILVMPVQLKDQPLYHRTRASGVESMRGAGPRGGKAIGGRSAVCGAACRCAKSVRALLKTQPLDHRRVWRRLPLR